MKHILFILLATLILFTTCKKYPGGGKHSQFFKNLEGQWKLQLYEVDGIDSTNLTQGSNSIANYLDKFATFPMVHTGKRTQIHLQNHYRNYTVSFNNKKREILGLEDLNTANFDSSGCLLYDSQMCQRNIFNPKNEKYFNWKIEKLTKTELILLSTIYNYKIILIK